MPKILRARPPWDEDEEFSTCWPEDALKAKGLVGDVRRVVNAKDFFTRMQQAQEKERRERLQQQREAAEELQRQRGKREALRLRLASLSSMADAHQRGIALEGVLNELFVLDRLLAREAFTWLTRPVPIPYQGGGGWTRPVW